MRRNITRHALKFDGSTEVNLVAGTKVVGVGLHAGSVSLWLDEPAFGEKIGGEPMFELNTFLVIRGNGEFNSEEYKYLGTVSGSGLVGCFHVFERL